MNQTCIILVIYPEVKAYLSQCLTSLQKQTYQNFQIILINDNFSEFSEFQNQFKELDIIELPGLNNIFQNRVKAIQFAHQANYQYIVFLDSDDYVPKNYLEICIGHLKKSPIIITDCVLINEDGQCIHNNYFSNRLSNYQKIDLNFLLEKNICGLGNTAIHTKILNGLLPNLWDVIQQPIAFDWFFYSKLFHQNFYGIFTSDAYIYYRQRKNHNTNFGSLENLDIKIKCKYQHYQLFQNINSKFNDLYNKHKNLYNNFINDDDYQKQYIEFLSKNPILFPFWWEQIQLYKD